MQAQNYFIFGINENLYGINTTSVLEVFYLPELKPISSEPASLVGTIKLRGEILPVIDILITKKEQQKTDYLLTDSVVIIEGNQGKLGIIVNEVQGVKVISPETIVSELTSSEKLLGIEKSTIIGGIYRDEVNIWILNELENWSSYQEIQNVMSASKSLIEVSEDGEYPEIFCPNISPEERAVLQQRAENLKSTLEIPTLTDVKSLAIVALSDNFLGIDLGSVREFTTVSRITPVPCCPNHIIGNANLRGEILTLVDIRRLLNLSLADIPSSFKVMVIEVEGIVAGVMVEEICDAMFLLDPQDIKPISVTNDSINQQYLLGIASYGEKAMSIVDLPKMLFQGGLIIDQVI